MTRTKIDSRRSLLRWLLASPLLAASTRPAISQVWPTDGVSAADVLDRLDAYPIESPDQAVNVPDIERIAASRLSPAHFGYIAGGVGDGSTIQANRQAIEAVKIRFRRLVNVNLIDTEITLLDEQFDLPIFVCPTGSNGGFHPTGDLGVAGARAKFNALHMLSTVASGSMEEVSAARGRPIWFQLYPTSDWAVTEYLVKRAEAAGCPAIVLTVDLQGSGKREAQEIYRRFDDRDCTQCHFTGRDAFARKGNLADSPLQGFGDFPVYEMDWDFLRRLRDLTSVKLLIKGIETGEDAELARKAGVDAVYCSNHGGRAMHGGRGSLEALPEVVEGAGGLPVLVDGGFRRGTDVFKALALGASAVGIGRPYIWGLAAWGQAGVERVLELMLAELRAAMSQAGVTRISEISSASVDR